MPRMIIFATKISLSLEMISNQVGVVDTWCMELILDVGLVEHRYVPLTVVSSPTLSSLSLKQKARFVAARQSNDS